MMKLSIDPSIRNWPTTELVAHHDTQVLMDEVMQAVYQESGGEANGYHFTIKIHKENENGDSLSGTFFEVIRDSSGVKVGRLLQTAMVMESLGGLLKDKYTR